MEARYKDAAKKLLQINSTYAKINPETNLLKELKFSLDEIDDILSKISISDFGLEQYTGPGRQGSPGGVSKGGRT